MVSLCRKNQKFIRSKSDKGRNKPCRCQKQLVSFRRKKQCQPAENHKTQSHINRSHNGKTHFFIYAKPVFSHILLLMTDRKIVCMPGQYNLSVLFFNQRISPSDSFVHSLYIRSVFAPRPLGGSCCRYCRRHNGKMSFFSS